MKAIQIDSVGGPEVLQLKEVPTPVPGPNQVLIKVSAVGVSPCDVYLRSGSLPGFCPLPYIPGGEVAGTVQTVGQNVSKFKPGDRVYSLCKRLQGACAEYVAYDETEVFQLHSDLTFAEGAAVGMAYFTAYRALFTVSQAKAGDSLLVHGASGAVGVAACQMAKAYGMTVLGTAGSEKGMEMILKNGADKAFNHRDPNQYDQIRACCSEKGVQIILENAANKYMDQDVELIGSKGTIAIIGGVNMQTLGGDSNVNFNATTLSVKEACVRGVLSLAASDSETAEAAQAADKGMKEGWLRPQINRTYPLADACKAHAEILAQQDASHSGSLGKLVLLV